MDTSKVTSAWEKSQHWCHFVISVDVANWGTVNWKSHFWRRSPAVRFRSFSQAFEGRFASGRLECSWTAKYQALTQKTSTPTLLVFGLLLPPFHLNLTIQIAEQCCKVACHFWTSFQAWSLLYKAHLRATTFQLAINYSHASALTFLQLGHR